MSLNVRYGVSYISVEQAKKNLRREIKNYKLKDVVTAGRKKWNDELSKIEVEGGTQNDKFVFYTSLYRCLERPVNISEDGYYFSVYDNKVHALKNINLKVEEGDIYGIIGYSGAGKSTLVRLLNGLEVATDGEVIIDGEKRCYPEYESAKKLALENHCSLQEVYQFVK